MDIETKFPSSMRARKIVVALTEFTSGLLAMAALWTALTFVGWLVLRAFGIRSIFVSSSCLEMASMLPAIGFSTILLTCLLFYVLIMVFNVIREIGREFI